MPTMTSRERVLTALRREQPDRVPYCEWAIDRSLATRIMGWPTRPGDIDLEARSYTVDEMIALADRLHVDNLTCVIRAPVYCEMIRGQDGRLFYGEGQIKSEADLDKLILPDPRNDALYARAEEIIRRKGTRAAAFGTRIGVFPAMLSMGIETFSLALYDNPRFAEKVMDIYFDWTAAVAERVCRMGFDLFVTTDDHAFKTGPLLSPALFRKFVIPRYQRVRSKITLPWVMHSDGNLMSILDDLIALGISGLHPIEKGAMDIEQMKRDYGQRICLLGNVDLNILGIGTPQDVDDEVRWLMREIAPGGGYIISSGNSLASYLKPDNVLAMAQAIQHYGRYPNAA